MAETLPPELRGTSWDTPYGRARYAEIAEDPPTPEQLCTPEPWLDIAAKILYPGLLPNEAVRWHPQQVERTAQALGDAYAAGLRQGEW